MLSDRIERAPLTDEDIARGYTGGVVTFIDQSAINIDNTLVETLDFQLDYAKETESFGEFRLYAVASHAMTFEENVLADSEVVNLVGFEDGPLEWRGNIGLDWNRGPWSAGWNMQYYDSHLRYSSTVADDQDRIDSIVLEEGSDKYRSDMSHDFYVRYRFDRGSVSRYLEGVELALSIQNAFNQEPELIPDVDGVAQFSYSTYIDPRLRRYAISLRKSF